MGEPAFKLPEEDQPDIRPRLRALEDGGETTPRETGHLSSVDEDHGGADGDESADAAEGVGAGANDEAAREEGRSLFNAAGDSDDTSEKSESADDDGDSLYNPSDNKKGLGGLSKGLSRLRGFGKLSGRSKLGIAIGSAVAGFMVIVLLIFMLFMSALKIPHLMENVTTYQMARVAQQAARQDDRTFGAKIAQAAAKGTKTALGEDRYNRYATRYNTGSQAVKDYWGKMTSWSPNNTLKSLNTDHGLQFVYDQKGTLKSIAFADKSLVKVEPSLIKGLIPGVKLSNNIAAAKFLAPDIHAAMLADGKGIIVRNLAALKLARMSGMSFVAWKAGQYAGKTSDEVQVQQQIDESSTVVENPENPKPVTDALASDQNDVQQAEASAIKDPAQVEASIKNGGVFPKVKQAMAAVGSNSKFQTVMKFGNPIYAVVTPMCIIYDGSISHAGQSIDNNTNDQIRTAGYWAAASDQIKDGATNDPKVMAALDAKVGDISNSAPMQTAAGETPNTTGTLSPQAGASGSTSILDVLFPGHAGATETVANKLCPVLTSTSAAVVGVIANVALAIGTGGGSTTLDAAGDTATEAGAQGLVKTITAQVTEKLSLRLIAKNTAALPGKAVSYIFSKDGLIQGGILVGTIGATEISKMIVANNTQILNDGSGRNNDEVNTINSGMNLYANGIARQGDFGAPMTKTAVAESNASDLAYIRNQNAQQSTYQRYFAFSNANSLASTMGMSLYSTLGDGSWHSFFGNIVSAFNINTVVAKLFGGLSTTALAADGQSTIATYGNVQWGWTAQEVNLMTNDPTYESFENQHLLDVSGKADAIASKYGKCFGVDGTTQGTLLQNGDLRIDDNGNAINNTAADCSPMYLGPNNPDYGDLVFRWRVAQSDDNDLANDIALANPTPSSNSTTASSGANFRIATFNAMDGPSHPSDSDKACQRDPGQPTGDACYRTRSQNLAQIITGAQAVDKPIDVIGLQELSQPQYNYLMSALGSNYASWPATYKPGGELSKRSIVWDTRKFTYVDGGSLEYPWYPSSPDRMPWVKLKANDGSFIYVYNVHTVSSSYPNNSPTTFMFDGQKETVQNYGEKRMWAAKIILSDAESRATDGSAFFTGDYNSSFSISNPNDAGITRDQLPYCVFTADGKFAQTFDIFNKNTGKCPTKNGASYGGYIDQIYASAGTTVANWQHITSDFIKGTTDHGDIIVADIGSGDSTSSSSSSSSSGSSTANEAVGDDGFTSGSCVDYVEYILKRHSSSYHGGTLGDGKNVAGELGAKPYGYKVDGTPAVHAVVSFPGGPVGSGLGKEGPGHVALVTQVNGDGSIVVEESNWTNPYHYGTHTVSATIAKQLTYAHTEVGWH